MKIKFKTQWLDALRSMNSKAYWNKANTVEFFAFATKIIIIFPGLLFVQLQNLIGTVKNLFLCPKFVKPDEFV